MCVCPHLGVSVFMHSESRILHLGLNQPLSIFLRQVLLPNPEFTDLARLARELQGSPVSHFPSIEMIDTCHHHVACLLCVCL